MKLSKHKSVAGVYKIYNTKSKRMYVGQSKNLAVRFCNHADGLINGTHPNISMVSDCKRYGIDSFSIFVLEECKVDELQTKELEWAVKLYNQGFDLYNMNDKRIFYACNPTLKPNLKNMTKEQRKERNYSRTMFLID